MNLDSWEEDVTQRYDMFSADHERLRKELVDQLPDVYPAPEDQARRPHGHSSTRRKVLSWAGAISVLMAAAATVVIISTRPRSALGLEVMLQRMSRLNSLYLEGWIYDPTGAGSTEPFVLYLNRPHTYWVTKNNLPRSDGSAGFEASDGSQWISVNPDLRQAHIGRDNPQLAGLVAEELYALCLQEQVIYGDIKNYKLRDSEVVNGISTDVYETRLTMPNQRELVHTIWVRSSTSLPVRIEIRLVEERSKNSTPVLLIDRIAVNAGRPEWLPLSPPVSYSITMVENAPRLAERLRQHASSDTGEIDALVALAANGGSVLVGYSVRSAESAVRPSLSLLTSEGDSIEAAAIPVHTVRGPERQWQWSVIVPNTITALQSVSTAQISLDTHDGLTNVSVSIPVIQLSSSRMEEVMAALQTDPSAAPTETSALTWQAVQQAIAKLRSS